jgi:hypothetical protein
MGCKIHSSYFYCQLIRDLGITGGDDAAVGYYAGIIVGTRIMSCKNQEFLIQLTGISVFPRTDTDSAQMESVV